MLHDISRIHLPKILRSYACRRDTLERTFPPVFLDTFLLSVGYRFVHVSRILFGEMIWQTACSQSSKPLSPFASLQHLHWAWARIQIYETYVDTSPFLGKCINRLLLSTCRYYINTELCILCGCHVSFIHVFLASPTHLHMLSRFKLHLNIVSFSTWSRQQATSIPLTFPPKMKIRKASE